METTASLKLNVMKMIPVIPLSHYGNTALPFKIQTLQHFLESGDDIQNSAHSHNHYEMVWVIKGGGLLYADLLKVQICNNSVFCIRPNQAHRFDLSQDIEGFVFSFTDSFFNATEQEFDFTRRISIFHIFSQSLLIRLEQDSACEIKEIVALIAREYEKRFVLNTDLLRSYFRVFILLLSRQSKETFTVPAKSRESRIVNAFVELLDKNFKEKKMVADYAEKLYITPNYLNHVVKRNTGYSASYHIKQRILLEAKRLGLYSDAAMKQIAYSLGFSDSAHFSKYFKSGSGTSFSDFKNFQDKVSQPPSFHRA